MSWQKTTLPREFELRELKHPTFALSLKQPWAALVVAGEKTIEVRTWATSVRGRVLIHAARNPDERPAARALVTAAIAPLAALTGGIIGAAYLTGCVMYRSATEFAADVSSHRNDPEWFQSPRMYGFTFRSATSVPYFPCRGKVRFFVVELPGPH